MSKQNLFKSNTASTNRKAFLTLNDVLKMQRLKKGIRYHIFLNRSKVKKKNTDIYSRLYCRAWSLGKKQKKYFLHFLKNHNSWVFSLTFLLADEYKEQNIFEDCIQYKTWVMNKIF